MRYGKKFWSGFMTLVVLISTIMGTVFPVYGAEQKSETISEKIKVACVGDSITYGHGSTNPAVNSYPAQLKKLMGIQYDVTNFGNSGKTMNDDCGWNSYISTNEYANSKSYQPDIVIIMLGTNDSKDNHWVSEERYERSARALIQSYQELSSKPLIYIATSPEVADDEQMKELNEPEGNYIWNSRIRDTIVPLQKKIAQDMGCQLIDINAKTKALENLNDYLSYDLIHPHNQGYELLAQWIYPYLGHNVTGILPEGDTNSQTWENERYNNYGGQPFIQLQNNASTMGIGESANPDWNYDCKIGFLKFDLSQYDLSTTRKEIESAYLYLNYLGQKSGSAIIDSVRIVLANPDWQEGTGVENGAAAEGDLTGMNQPELYYDSNDLEKTSVVSHEFATDEGEKIVQVDVTKLVRQFKKAYPEEQYISFAFNETAGGNRLQFGSKESGDGYGTRLHINLSEESALQKSFMILAVAMAEKLEQEQTKSGCYTEESWMAVQTVLVEARTLLNSPQVTQEEIDTVFLKLMTACNLLVSDVQRVGLKAAIDGTEMILAESDTLVQYTQESIQAVKDNLTYAKRVYELTSADQTTVNSAATSLMNAVNSLLIQSVDSRLDILIQKAEELLKNRDLYTDASVTVLETELSAAKMTAETSQASPEEISQAYNNLAAAMASLVRKADKSELTNALNKANEILKNTPKYVPDTIAGLAVVTEKAERIYNDQMSDPTTVGDTVKELVSEILKARLIGDVNMDGNVDTADSAEVLQFAAECKSLTEDQLKAADVNSDGMSDSSDAVKILRYAADMIINF